MLGDCSAALRLCQLLVFPPGGHTPAVVPVQRLPDRAHRQGECQAGESREFVFGFF